jgi:hypothetical protein
MHAIDIAIQFIATSGIRRSEPAVSPEALIGVLIAIKNPRINAIRQIRKRQGHN